MAIGKCIVVTDDDEDEFFLLRRAFEKSGLKHKIVTISSAEETLDYLAGVAPFSDRDEYPFPDLLLLDVKMPGISGFDLLGLLRANPELSRMPVVILTNSVLDADMQRAKSLGAREFLTKPFRIEEYTELLRGLDKRWLRDGKTSTPKKALKL